MPAFLPVTSYQPLICLQTIFEMIFTGRHIPRSKFRPDLFRQPSLAEGHISPQAYRKVHSFSSPYRHQNPYGDQSLDTTPQRDRNPYRKEDVSAEKYEDLSTKYSSVDTVEGNDSYEVRGCDDERQSCSKLGTNLNSHFVNINERSAAVEVDPSDSEIGRDPVQNKVPFMNNKDTGRTKHKEVVFCDDQSTKENYRRLSPFSEDGDWNGKTFFADRTGARTAEGRIMQSSSSSWLRMETEDASGSGSDDSEDERDTDVHEILDLPSTTFGISSSSSRTGGYISGGSNSNRNSMRLSMSPKRLDGGVIIAATSSGEGTVVILIKISTLCYTINRT